MFAFKFSGRYLNSGRGSIVARNTGLFFLVRERRGVPQEVSYRPKSEAFWRDRSRPERNSWPSKTSGLFVTWIIN